MAHYLHMFICELSMSSIACFIFSFHVYVCSLHNSIQNIMGTGCILVT